MKVYMVLEDMGTYEIYEIVRKVFSTEKAAEDYIDAQKYPNKYDIEEQEVLDG